MSPLVTIVALTRYSDIFDPFAESVQRYCRGIPVIIVRDGYEVACPSSWSLVQGPHEFSMAGNANLGLRAAAADSDILYCGDDVRFVLPNTVEALCSIAYRDHALGILSPTLWGRGSPSQVKPQALITYCSPVDMWFPCVYIKRSVIDRIGYLDEQFDGFGSDDLDYCLRSIAAGFMLAVTNAVYVKHLGDDTDSPTTFTRRWGEAEWEKQRSLALSKLRNKYNTCPESFDRFISTGDISYLDGLNKLLVDGNPK